MAANRGKKWEDYVKRSWENQFPNSFFNRYYDVTTGYKAIQTPADFEAYIDGEFYLIECKSTEKNTFSLDFRQYDRLKENIGKGPRCGVILWFVEHKKACWVSIEEIVRMREVLQLKSINIKYLNNICYNIIDITVDETVRTYPKIDFKKMRDSYVK